jgi:non-specific protein-tyrosine kinase
MELKEYIVPLRKWWWLILSATLVATLASFMVARQQPDIFRARTTLTIGRAIDNPNPTGTEFWLTQQLAQTYAEIASREPVRTATMEALGLTWLPEIAVRAVPETQLIEITVNDTSPVRAQAVANESARQLILQSPTSTEQEEQSRQAFINEQLDGLETRIIETQDEIADKQEELAGVFSARQISDLQSQIAGLQAKLTTLQTNYANMLSNTQQGAINTLTTIEPAVLPLIPVGPKTMTTVLVAAAIGFTLAAGAAYLLEYLDDSVKSPDTITKVTGLATLAGIARISEDDDGGKLVSLSQPRSPTTEAYRVLRTGIQYSTVDNPNQIRLMVTSPSPSEGKSLTVANLAVVMAQAGNNILVIDADLRRPVQHKLFRLPQKGGLTTLLLEANLDPSSDQTLKALRRVIQQTSVEGLHILTSGPIPPNPSEMLGSTKMEVALQTLEEHYDYVIIDSPPVLAVTDAMVLARHSESVLLVVDASKTRGTQLRQAATQLLASNAHVIGVVLNRLSPRSEGYYSYYYYRHSYYMEDQEEEPSIATPTNGKSTSRWRRQKVPKSTGEIK